MKEGTFLHLLEKSRALWDQYFRRYEFFNLFLFFSHFPRIFQRSIFFIDLNFGPYVTTKMSLAEGRGREMEGGRWREGGKGGREREGGRWGRREGGERGRGRERG